jgi:single-strand DNA-binding protein
MPPTTARKKTQAKPKPEVPEFVRWEPEDKAPIAVCGNLTQDPELRFTPSGIAVCSLRIAASDNVQDEDGNWVEADPDFVSVNVWRDQAENAAESFQRGDRVVVLGTWSFREWEDRDENPRISIEINAREVGASVLWRTVTIKRARRSKG